VAAWVVVGGTDSALSCLLGKIGHVDDAVGHIGGPGVFDAVALHAYWSTVGPTRWNGLRWRLFAPPGVLRLVTECGRDKVRDGPNGTYLPSDQGENNGWQAQGLSGDQFLAELAAYDAELRADGVYGVVFTTSPDDEWSRKGFSLDDLADRCHGLTNLGPHDLEGRSPQALAWAAVAPIVKSVDQTAAIRRARPDAITVYRRRFGPAEQDAILDRCDAARVVGAVVEGLAGFRHPRLHVELLNEVGKGRRDQYLALCRVVVPQLRAIGLRVAGPSWATGDYEQEDWNAFVPTAPNPPKEPPVSDVALSVPTRVSHAADGNWGMGEPFGPCKGVVIHSTGGSGRTLEAEYIGAVNWFTSPEAGVSAHRIVGAGKMAEVCTSVHDHEKAYHAREPSNTNRRGIELAHPDGWDQVQYADFQYEAAGELIARWKMADEKRGWNWPIRLLSRVEAVADAPGLVFHRDLPAGITDGRRDPTPPMDGAKLIAAATRWYAAISGGGGMPPTPTKPPPADPTALHDRVYALAQQLQDTAAGFEAGGMPHGAAYVRTQGEAIKEWVNARKAQT
jgi:hypothetical protein